MDLKNNIFYIKASNLYHAYKGAKWEKNYKEADVKELQRLFARMEENLKKQDRTFYVIYRDLTVGLFSYVQTTLGQVKYALEHDMIPIVDFKNYHNSYITEDQIGKVNAWELFFENLCPVSLEDVLASEKYELCKPENMQDSPGGRGFFRKKDLWYWSEMYQHFVILNKESQEYIAKDQARIFPNGFERVLGVALRGTDYKVAKGHPLQPSEEEMIAATRKLLKKGYYQKIFVKTEEKRVVERFEKEFPGIVISMDSGFYDNMVALGTNIADQSFDRENDTYLKGMEYLSTIALLAKCEGLICGMNGGSEAALYMNGGNYRDVKIFFRGMSSAKDSGYEQ